MACITIEKADPTGHGGSSTTGNVAKEMLNTSYRKLLTEGVLNTELKSKLDELLLNMAVILTLINSNRKIKVNEFHEFCHATYLNVISIPWIELSPSAHIVLAHSAELIADNGNKGLLNYSESGLEANNKSLRRYRLNRSINRLRDKSDPVVAKRRERLSCRHCNGVGHTIRSCADMKAELSGCNSEFESLLSFLTDFS